MLVFFSTLASHCARAWAAGIESNDKQLLIIRDLEPCTRSRVQSRQPQYGSGSPRANRPSNTVISTPYEVAVGGTESGQLR